MYENSKISIYFIYEIFSYMKLYDKQFFHTMKLYDKHFFHKLKFKKLLFRIFVFQPKHYPRIFCHEKTQSVTGSYHADKLPLVVLAITVNYNIFTWKYIPKN